MIKIFVVQFLILCWEIRQKIKKKNIIFSSSRSVGEVQTCVPDQQIKVETSGIVKKKVDS